MKRKIIPYNINKAHYTAIQNACSNVTKDTAMLEGMPGQHLFFAEW